MRGRHFLRRHIADQKPTTRTGVLVHVLPPPVCTSIHPTFLLVGFRAAALYSQSEYPSMSLACCYSRRQSLEPCQVICLQVLVGEGLFEALGFPFQALGSSDAFFKNFSSCCLSKTRKIFVGCGEDLENLEEPSTTCGLARSWRKPRFMEACGGGKSPAYP